MSEDTEEVKESILKQWVFDNYSPQHWEEKEAGKVDKTKSWVEVTETEAGLKATIFKNTKQCLIIDCDRDQWGTWISFRIDDIGFTIAQEDSTASFMAALIKSLTFLKRVTDWQTEEPQLIDFGNISWENPEPEIDYCI